MVHKILEARESRFGTIQSLTKEHEIIISVKANTPGEDKNRYSSYFLTGFFEKQLGNNFILTASRFFESNDGPFFLCTLVEKDAFIVKHQLIEIETRHPLGRLVDLDLYVGGQMVSRSDVNISKRKCLLCDNDAAVCSRNKNHEASALLKVIDEKILNYLNLEIALLIDIAMLKELDLEHKFGLVTPLSNGSHPDMNYQLMLESKKIIIPYLVKIFELGFNFPDDDLLFDKARLVGLEAEDDMFKLTQQINTYKGLIYVLGFILLSLGILIKKNRPLPSIYQQVKQLASNVMLDFNHPGITAGIQAYSNHGITGIRGEVFNGLPTIQKATKYFKTIDTSDPKHQHAILLCLMSNSEDTVLLKRAGSLEAYKQIKASIKKIDPYDNVQITNFTKHCIKENLSFGGSADLFVVFHFLELIKKRVL